jgi:hypothetical protein
MSNQSLAIVLEHYASYGERDLLPVLADALTDNHGAVIPQQTALAAIRHLSAVIGKRKAHSAWICLWRLSGVDTHSGATELLESLQDLPECNSILKRCVVCLALSSPEEQRRTCVKFLIAFMHNSVRRRRMVLDTEELAYTMAQLAFDDNQFGSVMIVAPSTVMLSQLSLVYISVEPGDTELCRQYCMDFLDVKLAYSMILRGLDFMARKAHQLAAECPEQFQLYFTTVLHALGSLWSFLSAPWAVSTHVQGTRYGFPRDYMLTLAEALLLLLVAPVSPECAIAAQAPTWHFLRFIEAYKGDVLLAPCLSKKAKDGGDRRNLLQALVCTGSDCEVFAHWYAKYPRVAVLVDKYCPEAVRAGAGAVAAATADGDGGEQGSEHPERPPNAIITPTAGGGDFILMRPQKDRRCVFPDCCVTGTEAEAEGGRSSWNCARCRAAYYCSKDHQTQHWWAAHRAMCIPAALQQMI